MSKNFFLSSDFDESRPYMLMSDGRYIHRYQGESQSHSTLHDIGSALAPTHHSAFCHTPDVSKFQIQRCALHSVRGMTADNFITERSIPSVCEGFRQRVNTYTGVPTISLVGYGKHEILSGIPILHQQGQRKYHGEMPVFFGTKEEFEEEKRRIAQENQGQTLRCFDIGYSTLVTRAEYGKGNGINKFSLACHDILSGVRLFGTQHGGSLRLLLATHCMPQQNRETTIQLRYNIT